MTLSELATVFVRELEQMFAKVDENAVRELQDRIGAAKRVFVAGAGRSGLMMRAFAMRLMHLGFEAFVVGDATTPCLQAGDLLVIGSGSGETGSLIGMALKAKEIKASLALITIVAESTLGKLADSVVQLQAPSPKARTVVAASSSSIQPMGSLFEQGLLLILDMMIVWIAADRGISSEQMFTRHANLE